MKTKIFFTSLLMAVFFLTSLSYSGVQNVGWQGRVIDSGTGHPLHGNYTIIYSIYQAASGGSPLWTETQSTFIDSGIAEVLLGSVTPIPDSVFNGSVRFLGVKVGSDPEMGPRSEMVSVPYASYAFAGGGWKDSGNVVTLATGTDKVGIGTSTPEFKLDVNGDAHFNGLVKIGQNCLWVDKDKNRFLSDGWLRVIIDEGNSHTTDYFSVSKDEGLSGAPPYGPELFRVQENGNVGIGTSTPGFPLSFSNALGDKISLWGQSGNHYGFGIQSALLQIYSSAVNSDIAFGWGSSAAFTENMRIKGNGNVGIGTTAPEAKLEVKDNPSAVYASGPPVGYFGTETANKIALVGDASAGSSLFLPTGKNIGVYGGAAGGTENWAGYFDGNLYAWGNVGIGTTVPAARLHIGDPFSPGPAPSNIGVLAKIAGPTAPALGSGTKWGVVGYAETGGVLGNGNMYGIYGMTQGTDNLSIGVYGSNPNSGASWAGSFGGRVYMAGNVGIGTTTPNTKVDINGDIALRAGSYTATNGVTNHNIAIGARSFVRITGPNAPFTITGIAGGTDGKMVILYNATGQNMTIANESTSSTDVNRIWTMSADEGTIGKGNVTLIYDEFDHRWIVTALMQ